MEKIGGVFNHKLDKLTLRKLFLFRIGIFVVLLPWFLYFFGMFLEFCFGVNVEGIVKNVANILGEKGCMVMMVLFAMYTFSGLGLIPFIWLLSRYKFYLTNKTLEMIGKEYKWEYVFSVRSFEHPESAKEDWRIRELQEFAPYGKIPDASFCKVLIGNACKRNFCLDRIFLYLNNLNNLGSQSIDVRGAPVPVPQTPKSFFEGFILNTPAIKDFRNVILIKPKKFTFSKIKNLQKAEIDTQGLFEIYTNSPQTLGQDLPQKFLSAIIEYGKKIDKKNTLLITPQGIIAIKKHTSWTGIFSPVLFRSVRTQVIKEWQKYENFINLLELFNLLEKEK